jgi:hypothetical protein
VPQLERSPAMNASAQPDTPWIAGDRIRHGIFGSGKIIGINDERAFVIFNDGESRTIGVRYLQKPWRIPHAPDAEGSEPDDAFQAEPSRPVAATRLASTTRLAANDNNPRLPFRATWFDDIEEDTPKEEVIGGMLGVNEFSYIVGPPGSGKSAITTDAACHVAAGREWFGRKVRQGLVVFIAAEREKLTKRRMMAFKKHHRVKDVPLLVLGGRFDLTANLTNAREIVAAIKGAEEGTGEQCVWVIIDTLTRSFGAGDQNASKDMTKYVQACDEITDATGAHLTVIHHTGWAGDRAKGAIDLDGAVDASFIVKKLGHTYTLTCDGTNDGEEGPICDYAMKGIQVGTTPEGEATMAPVIVPATNLGKSFVDNMKGHNATVVEALRRIVASEGVVPDGPGYPDACLVVSEEQWRTEFYTTDKDVKPETMQQRFLRAKKQLLASEHVQQVGQWFFPT